MQYILSGEEYQEFCRLRAESAKLETELASEKEQMIWPSGVLPGSLFVPHQFQGGQNRDCEICGAPDQNPVHTFMAVDAV